MAAKRIIGWREWVELPDLGVAAIKAKVDTGARSSSLHAFDMERFMEDGVEMIRFSVHPAQRRRLPEATCVAPVAAERLVRNPGGREEMRPVILTTVRLGEKNWPVELNLTRRDTMGFRMLLGRQAVRKQFLVDPGRSYLSGRTEVSTRPSGRRSG